MVHGRKVENIFLEDLKYENFDVTSACFQPFLDVLEDFQSVKIYDSFEQNNISKIGKNFHFDDLLRSQTFNYVRYKITGTCVQYVKIDRSLQIS